MNVPVGETGFFEDLETNKLKRVVFRTNFFRNWKHRTNQITGAFRIVTMRHFLVLYSTNSVIFGLHANAE